MNALGQRIADLIRAQGPLTVAQFMAMALHDPENGYYATRDPLGAAGDFITAPEISQIFGELLGLWTAQCWHDQGKPKPARLVELGPGRGTLMRDALRAAKLMPEFRDAIEVVLVESNPVLRAAQQDMLKDCGVPVRWCGGFDEIAQDRPLFLLANEFLDALPIRQFARTERGWCERMVTLDANGELTFALAPDAAPLTLPAREDATLGAVYEASPASTALIASIAYTIAHIGGAALVVDYGYGENSGFGDTLQAVKQNAFAKLLDLPGEADISAHVDFAALVQTIREAGTMPFGPVEQGDFLIDLGIEARGRRLQQADSVNRLVNPSEMGALFKALAILPSGAPKPAGF